MRGANFLPSDSSLFPSRHFLASDNDFSLNCKFSVALTSRKYSNVIGRSTRNLQCFTRAKVCIDFVEIAGCIWPALHFDLLLATPLNRASFSNYGEKN